MDLTRGAKVWEPPNPVPLDGRVGRVRFMRVLRPRSKAAIGFVQDEGQRFRELFALPPKLEDAGIDPIDFSPLDAPGMVLGVSTPVEWNSI
jgi:hypothetical protein